MTLRVFSSAKENTHPERSERIHIAFEATLMHIGTGPVRATESGHSLSATFEPGRLRGAERSHERDAKKMPRRGLSHCDTAYSAKAHAMMIDLSGPES